MNEERTTTDVAQRKAIFQKLCEALLKHNDTLYLDYPKVIMGYSTKVTGIQYRADGLIRLVHAAYTG
jgi:peptide/nickel transport system substrate-binding protein